MQLINISFIIDLILLIYRLFNYNCSILLKNKLENQTYVDFNLFNDSGHVITISKNRKEFEKSVLDFIKKI